MAYDIGAKLGIDGEAQFQSSIRAINSNIKALGAEMAAVTTQFTGNEKSMEVLTAKNAVLTKQIATTKEQIGTLTSQLDRQKAKLGELGGEFDNQAAKLNELKEALEKAKNEFGAGSEEAKKLEKEILKQEGACGKAQNAYNKQAKTCADLQKQLYNATASLNKLSGEAEQNEKDMSLLNRAFEGVKEAGGKVVDVAGKIKDAMGKCAEVVSKAADSIGKGFNAVSGVGEKALSGIKTAGTVAAAGIAAVTGAVTALGKSSMDAYADYEQLVGGVETLFGAGGKSIEEYAASVGKTVDDVKFEYAELMEAQEKVLSNANDAYKNAGLSANEYMETVTSFAAALVSSLGGQTDIAADVANTAIEDMADNANKMGTSMESIQKAYQGFAKQNYTMLDNLKLGYGGTKEEMVRLLADAEKLTGKKFDISNFADIVDAIHAVQEEMGITGTTAAEASKTISGSIVSMKSAWQNLLAGFGNEEADMGQLVRNVVNSVETVAQNIMPRVKQIASGIIGSIPELIKSLTNILPEFLGMGVEAGQSLIDGFGDVIPDLISAGGKVLENIATGIAGNIGVVVDGITSVVSKVSEEIGERKEELKKAGSAIIKGLAEGLSNITEEILPLIQDFLPTFIEGVLTYKDTLFTVGLDIITAIAQGLAENIDQIVGMGVDFLTTVITAIQENLPMLAEAAITIITGLADGLGEALPDLIPAIVDIIVYIVQTLIEHIPELLDAAGQIIAGLAQGFLNAFPELQVVWDAIKQGFSDAWKAIKGVWDTVVSFFSGIWDKIKSIFSTVKSGLTGYFSDAWDGIKNCFANVHTFFSSVWKNIKNVFSDVGSHFLNIGKSIVQGIWNGISNMASWIKDKVSGFFSGIVNGVKGLLGIHSPSTVFSGMGKNMALGLGKGWDGEYSRIKRDIESGLDFGTATVNIKGELNAVKGNIRSSMDELTSNAVPDGDGHGGNRPGGDRSGGSDPIDPDFLAAVIVKALDGVGVYMSGRKVGQLYTKYQANEVRARDADPIPV